MICGSVDLVGDSIPTRCGHYGVALVMSPGTKKDAPDALVLCYECAVGEIGVHGGTMEVGENQRREMGPDVVALADEIKHRGPLWFLRLLGRVNS